jgi:hypothetical protein
MQQYRLYCLDGAGKFTKTHEITAASDEDALSQARKLEPNFRCEIWQKNRKVAVLEPLKH